MLKRIAVIRSGTSRPCPYGLGINVSCHNAGSSVISMTPLADVPVKDQPHQRAMNIAAYAHNSEGTPCIYADKIVDTHNAVNCDYGDSGQGIKDFPMAENPSYPRIFNMLGPYGFYSYPLTSYHDNHLSESTFTGIGDLYSSNCQLVINKTAQFQPDSKLLKLMESFEKFAEEEPNE